jgi:hypothetical protein
MRVCTKLTSAMDSYRAALLIKELGHAKCRAIASTIWGDHFLATGVLPNKQGIGLTMKEQVMRCVAYIHDKKHKWESRRRFQNALSLSFYKHFVSTVNYLVGSKYTVIHWGKPILQLYGKYNKWVTHHLRLHQLPTRALEYECATLLKSKYLEDIEGFCFNRCHVNIATPFNHQVSYVSEAPLSCKTMFDNMRACDHELSFLQLTEWAGTFFRNLPYGRNVAARIIQRNWRLVVSNPAHLVCRNRLRLEINHMDLSK